ncbi:11315_t:CDS:1, partial [Gigaspora rosea]
TATIITLTVISIALIVLIIICVHKSCNKRKQRNQRRNNRVPDFQSGQRELRTLTQEQINSLPTDQQRKLRQY